MSRPADKTTLISQSQSDFTELLELINTISTEMLEKPGINGDWAIKDVLAHLSEWHSMMISWYQVGMSGQKPVIPAPGFTWKTTPQLNEKIFQEHKTEKLTSVITKLQKSHQDLMEIINSHSNEELFTKKKFAWTGTTSMGSYFVSATSSHYEWALALIKKWLKTQS